jgi:hypothetical protein
MNTRWIAPAIFSTAALLISVTPAAAQGTEARPAVAPVEFGATTGVLAIFPTFGARGAIGLSPRLALEGVAEYVPWIIDDRGGQHFILQGQLRQVFHQGQRWTWHATYGGSFFTRSDEDDADARIDTGGVHVGIGAEYPLSRRVAIRWDAQAIQSVTQSSYPIPRGSISITWR